MTWTVTCTLFLEAVINRAVPIFFHTVTAALLWADFFLTTDSKWGSWCVIHQKPFTVQQYQDLQPWKLWNLCSGQHKSTNKNHTDYPRASWHACVRVCVCILKLWIDICIPVRHSNFVCFVVRGNYKMPEPTNQKTNQRHLGMQPYFLHKTVSAFLNLSASWSFP